MKKVAYFSKNKLVNYQESKLSAVCGEAINVVLISQDITSLDDVLDFSYDCDVIAFENIQELPMWTVVALSKMQKPLLVLKSSGGKLGSQWWELVKSVEVVTETLLSISK